MPDKITKDLVVSLYYSLKLDDGTLVEETDKDDPLMYLHGYNNIVPGLESALEGLKVGDKKTIVVSPDEAYGEFEEEAIAIISQDDLPEDLEPEVGMLLMVEDEDDNEFPAQIVAIEEDGVVLDFNHPLAGEELHFNVEIVALRPATKSELEHGHAHMDGHDHD